MAHTHASTSVKPDLVALWRKTATSCSPGPLFIVFSTAALEGYSMDEHLLHGFVHVLDMGDLMLELCGPEAPSKPAPHTSRLRPE